MIGLIFGKTNFPKEILRKVKKRKLRYLIIDLTKRRTFRKDKHSHSVSIGQFGKIIKILKENKCSYIIQKINNYPTLLDIETMFKNVEQIDIDLVISIGGGSSIDIAKLYSSCILNEENLINVSQLLNRKPQDCIFSVAVPTTAGSGAESTKFATIWSKKSKEKLSFENENLIPNYVYLIGSDKLSTDLHNISTNANKKHTNMDTDYTFNNPDDPNRFYYRSDHYNFAKKGIPSIFYFSGVHADYHKHTDTKEKIVYEKVEKIARLIFYTAWDLSNAESRPIVDKINDFKLNRY